MEIFSFNVSYCDIWVVISLLYPDQNFVTTMCPFVVPSHPLEMYFVLYGMKERSMLSNFFCIIKNCFTKSAFTPGIFMNNF